MQAFGFFFCVFMEKDDRKSGLEIFLFSLQNRMEGEGEEKD